MVFWRNSVESETVDRLQICWETLACLKLQIWDSKKIKVKIKRGRKVKKVNKSGKTPLETGSVTLCGLCMSMRRGWGVGGDEWELGCRDLTSETGHPPGAHRGISEEEIKGAREDGKIREKFSIYVCIYSERSNSYQGQGSRRLLQCVSQHDGRRRSTRDQAGRARQRLWNTHLSIS